MCGCCQVPLVIHR